MVSYRSVALAGAGFLTVVFAQEHGHVAAAAGAVTAALNSGYSNPSAAYPSYYTSDAPYPYPSTLTGSSYHPTAPAYPSYPLQPSPPYPTTSSGSSGTTTFILPCSSAGTESITTTTAWYSIYTTVCPIGPTGYSHYNNTAPAGYITSTFTVCPKCPDSTLPSSASAPYPTIAAPSGAPGSSAGALPAGASPLTGGTTPAAVATNEAATMVSVPLAPLVTHSPKSPTTAQPKEPVATAGACTFSTPGYMLGVVLIAVAAIL